MIHLHTMDWEAAIKSFKAYLQLERSLSPNSVEGYLHDVKLLHQFLQLHQSKKQPQEVTLEDLQQLIAFVVETGLSDYSQARILSGVRSFYKFLLMEDFVQNDPTLLLEGPKLKRKLPDVLHVDEINKLMESIDHSKPDGIRNR